MSEIVSRGWICIHYCEIHNFIAGFWMVFEEKNFFENFVFGGPQNFFPCNFQKYFTPVLFLVQFPIRRCNQFGDRVEIERDFAISKQVTHAKIDRSIACERPQCIATGWRPVRVHSEILGRIFAVFPKNDTPSPWGICFPSYRMCRIELRIDPCKVHPVYTSGSGGSGRAIC